LESTAQKSASLTHPYDAHAGLAKQLWLEASAVVGNGDRRK